MIMRNEFDALDLLGVGVFQKVPTLSVDNIASKRTFFSTKDMLHRHFASSLRRKLGAFSIHFSSKR